MIQVRNAYQDFMDAEQIKRNEAKIKTQETKTSNALEDLYIQRTVLDYLKQEVKEESKDRGGILRLDRMPPLYGAIVAEFDEKVNKRDFSSFTITFRPEIRDNLDELGLCRYLKKTFPLILHKCPDDVEILLIPDCDEAGNFHYHGLIKMNNKFRPRFKKLMMKNVGFIKMKYITDPEGWKKYCFKDIYTEKDITDLYISI